MIYMGSKRRIAKDILPIILKDRKEGQWFVDIFCGGCNLIDKVDGKRIANDYNEYLIDFWKAVQSGWLPPNHITKDEYIFIKDNKDVDKKLTLWAGIGCSYGGKWFGGWINDYKESRRQKNGKLPNHQKESLNGLLNQVDKLNNVKFFNKSYNEFDFKEPCIIYCDPPYENTTSYKDSFNHVEFWQWCRDKANQGHSVFISEYNAPNDFECLLEISTNTQLGNGCNTGNQTKTEKLFTYKANQTIFK